MKIYKNKNRNKNKNTIKSENENKKKTKTEVQEVKTPNKRQGEEEVSESIKEESAIKRPRGDTSIEATERKRKPQYSPWPLIYIMSHGHRETGQAHIYNWYVVFVFPIFIPLSFFVNVHSFSCVFFILFFYISIYSFFSHLRVFIILPALLFLWRRATRSDGVYNQNRTGRGNHSCNFQETGAIQPRRRDVPAIRRV